MFPAPAWLNVPNLGQGVELSSAKTESSGGQRSGACAHDNYSAWAPCALGYGHLPITPAKAPCPVAGQATETTAKAKVVARLHRNTITDLTLERDAEPITEIVDRGEHGRKTIRAQHGYIAALLSSDHRQNDPGQIRRCRPKAGSGKLRINMPSARDFTARAVMGNRERD